MSAAERGNRRENASLKRRASRVSADVPLASTADAVTATTRSPARSAATQRAVTTGRGVDTDAVYATPRTGGAALPSGGFSRKGPRVDGRRLPVTDPNQTLTQGPGGPPMLEDVPVAGTALDPGLWSGKRRSPRKRRTLSVEVGEAGGTVYEARTVDVSRGGMLLEFVDAKLAAPSDPGQLIAFATRLTTMFPTGMDISFGSGAVRTRAHVVRLVSGGSATAPILLGCAFYAPLPVTDCRLLGIGLEGDESEGPAAGPPVAGEQAGVEGTRGDPAVEDELVALLEDPTRSWTPDEDVEEPAEPRHDGSPRPALGSPMLPPWAEPGEVVLHLFPRHPHATALRYRGRLLHAEAALVVADVPIPPDEGDPFGWVAALGANVRVVAVCDGRVLWESTAATARFDMGDGEHVRVSLRPDGAPPAALLHALAR